MAMRKYGGFLMALVGGLVTAAPAMGQVDVPITPLKLIIVNKGGPGAGKVVFVAKDTAITKGTGTDPAQITSEFDVGYGSAYGVFLNPSGSNWLANKDTVAKYVNKTAPTGGATKVSIIKPGKLIKNVAKSLGDSQVLDISTAPTGDVCVAYAVWNPVFPILHFGKFTSCTHKSIAGGTGFKLICKGTGAPWDGTVAGCAGLIH